MSTDAYTHMVTRYVMPQPLIKNLELRTHFTLIRSNELNHTHTHTHTHLSTHTYTHSPHEHIGI